ncbi:MAG: S8 family peptidase [Cyclobacteriaceae bacterium]|nr:S8 family peptidase [Cyclobacteriaceae bacterium]
MSLIRPVVLLLALFQGLFVHAQSLEEPAPHNWFLLDPATDHVQGVSAEKAYRTLLQDRPSRTVLVAVIDSGIDIDHEDLKGIIWTNPREIAGNGLDDDKNGYIDDVHGWNFIGGKEGNVNDDSYELTREYARLSKKFAGVEESKVSKKDKSDWQAWQKVQQRFDKEKETNQRQYTLYKNIASNVFTSIDTLKKVLKTDSLTRENLSAFTTSNPTLLFSKGFILNVLRNMGPESTVSDLESELKEAVDHYERLVEYGYNLEYNPRTIVGDNYLNVDDRNYGNNDVKGPDPDHGTHVAGIIAADRTNGLGINGIASNVRIMVIRAVPNGDERDKDVANAIRYAVDNGAQIINMSFGKSMSPQKSAVDRAVRYAEQKGVLLIHAAGNEKDDNDEEPSYPSRYYQDGKEARNWIEVGASGADSLNLIGSFSNFGKKAVDLFAPGVDIYSTVPGSKYKNNSGTSMACPATTGVVAVLMSYFPELSPLEIKDILLRSVRRFDGLHVTRPSDGQEVDFNSLSRTGGLVNVYEAVKAAIDYKKTKSAPR